MVQRVVNSTIRKILGRFIKGGEDNIHFDNPAGGALHLKDLDFNENTLNLLLAPFIPPKLLTIKSAKLSSFQADITWKGGTLHWKGISVHLSQSLGANYSSPPPNLERREVDTDQEEVERTDEDNPMGWSLRSYSGDDLTDVEEGEALLASLRNSFSSPLVGVQRKIDEISDCLLHIFKDIEIIVAPFRICLDGQYSKGEGLLITTLQIELLAGNETVLDAKGVFIPAFDEESLGNVTALSLHGKITSAVLEFVMTNIKRLGVVEESNEESRLKSLAVEIQQFVLEFEELGITLHLEGLKAKGKPVEISAEWSKLELNREEGQFIEVEGVRAKVLTADPIKGKEEGLSASSGIEEMTGASSPFEDDKVFLFRAQPIPHPIASIAHYKAQQELMSAHRVLIKCSVFRTSSLVLDEWLELASQAFTFLPILDEDNNKLDDARLITFELKVEHQIELRVAPFPLVTIAKPSFFKGTTEYWSVKASQVVVGDQGTIGLLHGIRLAGEGLKRVSVDIKAGFVADLDTIMDLTKYLPPLDPDQPPMDLFIRVKQAKLRANRYHCRDVRAANIEVFTGNDGSCVTITAGRAESKSTEAASYYGIRATALQVTIGDDPTFVKVSVAALSGIASNEDLKDVIAAIIGSTRPEARPHADEPAHREEEDAFRIVFKREDIIRNYMHGQVAPFYIRRPAKEKAARARWKVTVRQSRLKLYNVNEQALGHVELVIDLLKIRLFTDAKLLVSVERAECLDRIKESVWNKAIIMRGLCLVLQKNGQLRMKIGGKNTSPYSRSRKEDVTLSLDQCFLDYIGQFISTLSSSSSTPEEARNIVEQGEDEEEQDQVWLASVCVTPFKARLDYKPSKDSSTPIYLRYLPLRSAVLKVDRFDAFDLTGPEELGMRFALHSLGESGRNLGRILAGFKPIRTPANVFRNAAELVLVPLNAQRGGLTQVINQARQAATRTAISILELGPAVNVRSIDANPGVSIHSNQPRGIKEGLARAGHTFKRDVTTVVAFITGDRRNVDLFDLPVMVLRPFTAPLTEILNGMCNQLDRERYERLKDKYG